MNTAINSPVLQKGSQGAAVKELQTLLNRHFGTRAIGDPLAVDGIFGAKTEDRVETAQFRYLLPSDGIVGTLTWQALRANAAPVAKLPVLRRGSTGVQVEVLQSLLVHTSTSKPGTDGVFGPKTEAAVREFQQSRQLQVDGIVGAKTWKALEPTATFLTFD